MVDYQESLNRMLSLVDYERSGRVGPRQLSIYDLRRTVALMERIGSPHTKAQTVHVAGTKGKGSTAAFCDAVLHASGYKTGFYSSPHLHTFRERIRCDAKPISEAEFSELVEQIWPQQEWVTNNVGLGPVTLFEFMTAMGFLSFAKRNVDFQTMEVGLGGRLDATNVVNPNVSVITSISLDHTGVLGDSLAQIAAEKAGIIKPGVPVVLAPQGPEATSAIAQVCQREGVRQIQVGRDVTWEAGPAGAEKQSLVVQGRLGRYRLTIPLLGSHQLENAATAVAALEVLREQGHSVPEEAIAEGFANVDWPCRMEVISRSPVVMVDGAHNGYSVDALIDSLPRHFEYSRLLLIAGFSADKQVKEMVKRLSRVGPIVIATGSRNPRALPPQAVAALFREAGVTTLEAPTPRDALDVALSKAGENDLVLAAGSLFLAAEVREAALGIEPELYPDLAPSGRERA